MQFFIQSCAPSTIVPNDATFYDLSHLIQSIFPMKTDNLFLIWNSVPIRLGYKYDISVIIDTLMPMLQRMLQSSKGEQVADFGSDTFLATWKIQWDQNEVYIESSWTSILGGYEALLNARPNMQISYIAFLHEWGKLLIKLRDTIMNLTVLIDAENEWEQLNNVIQKIQHLN